MTIFITSFWNIEMKKKEALASHIFWYFYKPFPLQFSEFLILFGTLLCFLAFNVFLLGFVFGVADGYMDLEDLVDGLADDKNE